MVDKYMVHLAELGDVNCRKCNQSMLVSANLPNSITYVSTLQAWKAFSNVAKPNEYYRCKYA